MKVKHILSTINIGPSHFVPHAEPLLEESVHTTEQNLISPTKKQDYYVLTGLKGF